MLPVNVVFDMTRYLMGITFSQIRGKELDTQKASMDARLRELQINANKDVYLSLIALSKHAFDRQMDFFVQAFGEFMEMMKQQQLALESELKILREKKFTVGHTSQQFIQIEKSCTDVRIQLEQIRSESAAITYEFNMRVTSLSPELRFSLPRI